MTGFDALFGRAGGGGGGGAVGRVRVNASTQCTIAGTVTGMQSSNRMCM
jgi:hypothetical protein